MYVHIKKVGVKMNNIHVKKGDTVMVNSGADKGKKGKVLQAMPSENKILVEGVNVRTKHTKPRRAGETGGIVKQAATVNVSKVMVVCKKCNSVTRVAHTTLKDGSKVRTCKKCNESLDK